MANLVLLPDDPYGMGFSENKAVIATSRAIAEIFDKRHDNVLRDIEGCECSDGFRNLNFKVSYYRSGKGKYKEYLLTKDGFAFLAMGFTGKKAAAFKEAYITRFNEMERILATRNQTKIECSALTDAIQKAHDPVKPYHYSNEMDMINRIVTGKSAKQLKSEKGLPDNASVRDYMTEDEIRLVQHLQTIDAFLNSSVPDYQERKRALQEYVDKLRVPQLKEAI